MNLLNLLKPKKKDSFDNIPSLETIENNFYLLQKNVGEFNNLKFVFISERFTNAQKLSELLIESLNNVTYFKNKDGKYTITGNLQSTKNNDSLKIKEIIRNYYQIAIEKKCYLMKIELE